MGLQVVAEAESVAQVKAALGDIASVCEVFAMSLNRFGVSVPMGIVDETGESEVRRRLAQFTHFDLWEGKWKSPKSRWRFW